MTDIVDLIITAKRAPSALPCELSPEFFAWFGLLSLGASLQNKVFEKFPSWTISLWLSNLLECHLEASRPSSWRSRPEAPSLSGSFRDLTVLMWQDINQCWCIKKLTHSVTLLARSEEGDKLPLHICPVVQTFVILICGLVQTKANCWVWWQCWQNLWAPQSLKWWCWPRPSRASALQPRTWWLGGSYSQRTRNTHSITSRQPETLQTVWATSRTKPGSQSFYSVARNNDISLEVQN